MSDVDMTEAVAVLRDAGFVDVVLKKLDRKIHWTSGPSLAEAVALFAHVGPGAAMLRALAPSDRRRAMRALRDGLREHVTAEGLVLGCAAWVITARRG